MAGNKVSAGVYPAVFLDRDGVINKEVDYISNPEQFELIPRVAEAIKKLKDSGYKIIVVTNQSGISRGFFTEDILIQIHKKMTSLLEAEGASIDGIYYCPHHPNDDCACRKPKPEMVMKAAQELGIDLERSFFIGDTSSDIECGLRAGVKTILVETGYAGMDGRCDAKPDYRASDLFAAAEIILEA